MINFLCMANIHTFDILQFNCFPILNNVSSTQLKNYFHMDPDLCVLSTLIIWVIHFFNASFIDTHSEINKYFK